MSHYHIDQTRTIFITWGLCLSMKLLMKVLCSSEIIMRAHLSGLTLRAFKVKSCIKSSLSSEATGISPSRMWTIVTLGSFQVSLSCSTEVLNLFVTRQTLFFYGILRNFMHASTLRTLLCFLFLSLLAIMKSFYFNCTKRAHGYKQRLSMKKKICH